MLLNLTQAETVMKILPFYVQKSGFTKDLVFFLSLLFMFPFLLEKFFASNNNAMKAYKFAFITLNQRFPTLFHGIQKTSIESVIEYLFWRTTWYACRRLRIPVLNDLLWKQRTDEQLEQKLRKTLESLFSLTTPLRPSLFQSLLLLQIAFRLHNV